MNTPAHIIVNLLILGRHQKIPAQVAVLGGALLPDLPMLVFYGVAKVGMRVPEELIWNDLYYQELWQTIFACANSIPLTTVALIICALARFKPGVLCCVSMIVHIAFDLPLHNHDAHRHFFPLTDWRFYSPLSYWDPTNHGAVMTVLEIGLVILASVVIWRKGATALAKRTVVILCAAYSAYFGYVYVVWA